MYGMMGRGRARSRADHGEFKPAEGSFEFTGENANNTARWNPSDPRMLAAARAFLHRVGR
ncbi:MAG: hypothetical protein BroJett030_18330 [Alphaproteobacteria bacterium]|nr:MAG: hypothetical protein BroJett030_18330 [Alphaproteobacteria bacterium]